MEVATIEYSIPSLPVTLSGALSVSDLDVPTNRQFIRYHLIRLKLGHDLSHLLIGKVPNEQLPLLKKW